MDVKNNNHIGVSDANDDRARAVPPSLSASSPQQHTPEPLAKVLAMAKGAGDESYSKNSGLQASLNKITLLALNNALERVTLPSEVGGVVVTADLGSSSGPNAIDNMEQIIDKLRHCLTHKDAAQFQVFFNDLPSNDFNNLFQLLSNGSRAKNFYASGVPGSYFDRLFPQSSVHVFYSSNCLHWLSKIPDEVRDKDSPAFNRGKIWLMHPHAAVAASYQQQASLDLKNFLLARAAELISGGLLFFFCFGRSTSEPNDPTNDAMYTGQEDMDEVWNGLIADGAVTEHQRDTFNMPIYLRTVGDVEEAIANSGSLFHVLTVEQQTIDFDLSKILAASDITDFSRKMAFMGRAVFGSVFETTVGKKVSELIWQRYEKLIEKRCRASNAQDVQFKCQLCVVSLIRK